MASAIQSTGLASGLPINDIITKLTELSKAPIKRLEERKAQNEAKKTALQFISAQSLALSLLSFDLSKDATFAAKKVSSSNENLLTAIASSSAAAGTYKFKVGQVAQASQVTSNGFESKSSPLNTSGVLTINKGKNTLNQSTELSYLNGGRGVGSGSLRITDSRGNTDVIDLTTSLTINDVINKINSSSKVKVNAGVSEDGKALTIRSVSGDEITIGDVNEGGIASNLGIKGSSVNGQIDGSSLVYVTRDTRLVEVNDGFGVDITAKGINDLIIRSLKNDDAEPLQVDLEGAKTIGDVVDKINQVVGIEGYAFIEKGSDRISFINDDYEFSNAEKSHVGTQLGLVGGSGNVGRLVAGLNDSLLRNLNGSLGVSSGEILITVGSNNTNGAEAELAEGSVSESIHVNAAGSLQDLLKAINSNETLNLKANISSSGNNIELSAKNLGDNIDITVSNGENSTTASDLGLVKNSENSVLKGDILHKRKMTDGTLLSSLNNGNGIGTGSIEVKLANGSSRTISFASKNIKTVKDAITQIQGQFSKTSELEVRINDNGDGILLIDKTIGSGVFKISDKDDQKTASALGIAKTNGKGENKIDGTKEASIDILSSDSLEDIVNKINKEANLGVNAFIVNTGAGKDAYRLSIISKTTGADSHIAIESNLSGLDFKTTAEGLDSIVSYGSSQGATSPITLTSSNTIIKGGINGVDLNVKGVSDGEVTISIDREAENVKKKLQDFADKFNEIMKNIKNLTRFVPPDEMKDKINTGQTDDEKKKEADADAASGLLLGNSTLRNMQNDLYNLVSANVNGLTGNIRSFSQIGLVLQRDGSLQFNAEKFDNAYQTNAQDVIDVFTLSQNIMNKNVNKTSATIGGGLKVASGFNANNLLVDTISSSGYNDAGGDIGVKFTGKGYLDFTLGGMTDIKKIVLNQIDNSDFSAADFGLKKFKLQYKNAKGEYVDLNTFSQNNLGSISYTLPSEVRTNQMRIEVLDGNPNEFRLLSFQAFESKGTAFKLNDHLKKLTTPDEGDLSTAIATYDQNNQLFDDQIKRIQDRVDKESNRLTRQFSSMEKVISGLQGQGNVLSQTLNNLPKAQ